MTSPAAWDRTLLGASWILFVIAAVLVLAVVPPVGTDTDPGATPRQAATAFGVSAALHVLLGVWLRRVVQRGYGVPSKAQLWFLGLFAWLLGLVLLDGAFAFSGRAGTGFGMLTVTVATFACVAADFVAGLLAIARTFVRDQFESLGLGDLAKGPRS